MNRKRAEKEQDKTPTVLIVEDDQPSLELLQAYLEDVDCQTVCAHDGLEALEIMGKKTPDLVLLDIMMPKMSGFEVCKKIKNDPKTSDVPVIMITALNEFGDIERGINCGTDDFISKPVNKLELVTRVKIMLKLKHLSDKLERTLAYLSEIEKHAQMASSDSQ